MDCFEKSIEIETEYFPAIYNGALLLYDSEQYEQAKIWFEGARDATLKFDD